VNERSHTPWWRTPFGLVLCGFLIIAGFFLLTEHTAHVFGALPYLLLAACPLMHLFMHHGHGGHGGGESSADDRRPPPYQH
jgi:peptidoglycan/LPS O-acetylase OafA/YrhL